MAQEGIAAALKLDDQILKDLQTAQYRINQMKLSADALAKSFTTVNRELGGIVNTLTGAGKSLNLSASINTEGVVKDFQIVANAATNVGQAGVAAISKVDAALNKNRKEIEKTKKEISKRQGNLANAIGLDESSVSNINKKIAAIKKSIASLSVGSGKIFNAGAIANAEKDLTRLNNKLIAARGSMTLTQRAASNLGGMFRQVFSTVLISRFLSNVVQVRGEFEMSERSLAVIIKDANYAKEIFSEVQAIAIKSPFQVKDLVKYTKQLAAFRVENEKLVETTKMLGDISAGVGVDMDRLILAYGQVKAATYLKGTELRQFSEAGVNMLGGLADRFSEIQKRAVSTGEVLQMVSKRMVSFADVDAVLRQQTEFGGAFYKMQEKQAETIQGRISNIKDKLDIMFNEIGKSSQGVITFILDAIDVIIKNYGFLETALTAGTVFMAVMAIYSGLVKIGGALGTIKAVISLIASDGLLATMTASLGAGGPILAGILAISAAIAVIAMHATRLRRELRKMAEESQTETRSMLTNFEHLTSVIQDNTRSAEERNEAFEELKRQFGNVLPLEDENINTIKQGTEKYEEYAAAIREANNELLKEKQLLAVRDNRNKQTTKELNQIQSRLVQTVYTSGDDELEFLVDRYKMLPQIYAKVQEQILDGAVTDAKEATNIILSELERAYGKEEGIIRKMLGDDWVKNVFTNRIQKAFRAKGLIDTIDGQIIGDVDFGAEGSELREKMKKAFGNLYKGDDPERKRQAQEQGEKFVDEFTAQIEKSLNEKGNPLFNETQQANLKRELKRLSQGLMSPMQKALNDLYAQINEKFPNLPSEMGIGDMVMKDSEKAADAVKRLKETKAYYDSIVEDWKEIARQKASGIESPLLVEPTMKKEDAEAESKAIQMLIDGLGKLFRIAADKSAIAAQKKAVREFLTALRSASKEMDKLDDQGDVLFTKRLKMLAKDANIALPVDFDPKTIDFESFSKKYLSELSEEDRLKVEIEWNKEDTQNRVRELSKQIQDAWDRYQNAKRMEEYGLTPFDLKSSTEVLQELAAMEDSLRKNGAADEIALADEIAKKRVEIARTEQEKVAKIMYDAQKKSLSKAEQAYHDMIEQVTQIQTWTNKDERDAATQAVITRGMREMADAEWEAYKATEAYALAFGDLQGMSQNALRMMKGNLEKWLTLPEGALQPSEVQTIIKQIKKIDEQMDVVKTTTFFGAIAQGFKDIKEAAEAGKSIPELSEKLAKASEKYFEEQRKKDEADANYAAAVASGDQNRIQQAFVDQQSAVQELAFAEGILTEATTNLKTEQTKYNTSSKTAKERLDDISGAYSDVVGAINETIDSVLECAEAFGVVVDPETQAAIDGFKQGFELVGKAIGLATVLMTAFGVTAKAAVAMVGALLVELWPLLAAGAAIGALLAVFKARDAELEKQVEAHKDAVEKLEKSYEKLENAMDKALDIDKARKTYAEMNANIARQRLELQEAIAANNQRKQTDDVKKETQELQEQLDSLTEKTEDVRNEWLEMLGAITDYQSLARDWASDWLDAFKETGDGLDVLKKDFDELYDNLVVGQLWSKVVGPKIEALDDMVRDALGDGDLTESEAAALRAFKTTFAQANEDLKALATRLGISGGTFTGDSLQRGVSTVTEQTATALESILNSTRFDVADTNARMARIEDAIIGDGENTIMSHLRSQTRYLADIARIAGAIFVPGGHYKGGGGIKVFAEVK